MTGRLNINDGMFLGKEELVRQQEMTDNRSNLNATLIGYGIKDESNFDVKPSGRFVETADGQIATMSISKGYAVDIHGRPIYFPGNDHLYYKPGDHYIVISHIENFTETGRVKLSVEPDGGEIRTGSLVGEGTEFLKLFRPTGSGYKSNKIELYEEENGEPKMDMLGRYEIIRVENDTEMVISGIFPTRSFDRLFFKVVSTFSQDIVPTDDRRFTYRYDKCLIQFRPTDTVKKGEEFCIAYVQISKPTVTQASKVTVNDCRSRYINFQNRIMDLEDNNERIVDLEEFQRRQEEDNITNSNEITGGVNKYLSNEIQKLKNQTGNIETDIEDITNFPALLSRAIPKGSIIMWSGSAAPSGWALCNGDNGTPNLSGRFIVGYQGTESITGNYPNIGNHSTVMLNGSGSVSAAGVIGGFKEVALTVNQMPKHTHALANTLWIADASGSGGGFLRNNSGSNTGTFDTKTTEIGGNQPFDNRPPYYVLAYIMKIH